MNLKRTRAYLSVRQFVLASTHASLFFLTGGLGKDTTVVLMYHSVEADLPWAISATIFRKQMLYLKSHFRVVPFCQIQAEAQRPRGAGRVLSITFDDGRLDNYVHALPILEQTGLKATFFVATGTIGSIFRTYAYQTPMMDERQIRELVALGHEVGAHTVTHPALTKIPRSAAYAEMETSKRQLEDLLGITVPSIAYPFGFHNREVRDCAEEIGFRCAGIVRNALVTPQADWLRIPRVSIDHTLGSGLYFRAKASPAVEVYEHLNGKSTGLQEY